MPVNFSTCVAVTSSLNTRFPRVWASYVRIITPVLLAYGSMTKDNGELESGMPTEARGCVINTRLCSVRVIS